MELPDDVLQIIKKYSKPVTRADWKTNIFMNQKTLHNEFERQLCLRHFRIRNSSHTDVLRITRSYKPIFSNNYYKNFKYNFNE
jgi:hypothetical protein